MTDPKPTELRSLRLPDSPGWWARVRGNRVKWFRVESIEFSEPTIADGDAELAVYDHDRESFFRVAELTSPLTRWCGPVAIPGDPDV